MRTRALLDNDTDKIIHFVHGDFPPQPPHRLLNGFVSKVASKTEMEGVQEQIKTSPPKRELLLMSVR